MANYKTVKNEAETEMIERKSRFIGYCKNVATQEEAVEFIEKIRAMHRQATHNVYAYVLRKDNAARYSDDGEPAGTAGVPVLEVINKEGLTDVCVVVTRYFGGILLGAGGLVRAYGKSAKLAIDDAVRVEMKECSSFLIKCDYSFYGKIEYMINTKGYILKDTSFDEEVYITVSVPVGKEEELQKTTADITGGSVIAEKIANEYISCEI
ncbi:MAG: YigZ family protein [Clostridia bacterium]|nr:YigZ family protein [Clostridia bacterium]